jgi:hypothetical protein
MRGGCVCDDDVTMIALMLAFLLLRATQTPQQDATAPSPSQGVDALSLLLL